jgi:hypothetical protein
MAASGHLAGQSDHLLPRFDRPVRKEQVDDDPRLLVFARLEFPLALSETFYTLNVASLGEPVRLRQEVGPGRPPTRPLAWGLS